MLIKRYQRCLNFIIHYRKILVFLIFYLLYKWLYNVTGQLLKLNLLHFFLTRYIFVYKQCLFPCNIILLLMIKYFPLKQT